MITFNPLNNAALLRPILILLFFLLCFSALHAQTGCDINQFKALTIISKKDSLTDMDLDISVQLLKKLERNKCSDYIGKKNGREYVISGRTYLFGEICLRRNNYNAVKEYINYMKRNSGSAEEQISFSFERIFAKRPEDVFTIIGFDKKLLDDIVWGFLNNESALTNRNYKKRFYQAIPQAEGFHMKYKKQIDYLLAEISAELKSLEADK